MSAIADVLASIHSSFRSAPLATVPPSRTGRLQLVDHRETCLASFCPSVSIRKGERLSTAFRCRHHLGRSVCEITVTEAAIIHREINGKLSARSGPDHAPTTTTPQCVGNSCVPSTASIGPIVVLEALRPTATAAWEWGSRPCRIADLTLWRDRLMHESLSETSYMRRHSRRVRYKQPTSKRRICFRFPFSGLGRVAANLHIGG